MKKKISIITVNYNDKPGLIKTLESLFRQTWQDFEYIVVDGNSSDGSKEIISGYSSKINYAVSEPDSGIYNAMNKGIRAATGDYLFFLNAGDYFYDDEVLQKIQTELDGSIDFYYGNVVFKDGHQERIIEYPDKFSFHFFTYDCICHQASFIRRTLFDDHFYYNENLKIVSDWEFLIYTICRQNISYKHLDVIVCYYDFSGISSRPESEPLKLSERAQVMTRYFPSFINDYATMHHYLNSKRIKQFQNILNNKLAWKLLRIPMDLILMVWPKMKK